MAFPYTHAGHVTYSATSPMHRANMRRTHTATRPVPNEMRFTQTNASVISDETPATYMAQLHVAFLVLGYVK